MPKLSARREQGHHIPNEGGDTMSQRQVSKAYEQYRLCIETGMYALAREIYEQTIAAAPVSMLKVAIYDYHV